jgi:hypothetical protein
VVDGAGTAQRLDELAGAIVPLENDWLLAAPRIGYGIRARGGPPLVLPPVAHASPNDHDLLDRLARWRELHDPTLTDAELTERLTGFGNVALLVDTRTEELHDGVRAYGYLPDASRSRALEARLRVLGLPVLTEGEGWTVFGLTGRRTSRSQDDARAWFEVQSVSLGEVEARAGDIVPLELVLRATGESSTNPQRVFVRLEGDMPEIPAYAEGFSKLWRKLFVERSGRSQNRFGSWIAPADLVVPPERWKDGQWRQSGELRIPEWASPGIYTLQVTIHDWTWHPSYELRDYLNDEDRYTAPPEALLQIVD